MNSHKYTWEDVKAAEASGLQKGEFQGMVIQALQDLRGDITEMQREREVKGYINYAISGLIAAVVGFITGQVPKQ